MISIAETEKYASLAIMSDGIKTHQRSAVPCPCSGSWTTRVACTAMSLALAQRGVTSVAMQSPVRALRGCRMIEIRYLFGSRFWGFAGKWLLIGKISNIPLIRIDGNKWIHVMSKFGVNDRPVTRGGSYEPPHEITRSGFLICIKLLIQIIT